MFQTRHLISYKCLKCDTILPFRRKFAQHIRVNTQSKQITCLKFSAPGDEALSNYQCDLFLTDGLKKSQALCYTCGEIFSDKSAFLNHIETHGEVVEKRFVCELCPYATHVQCYLRYHTKHKHPTGPRVRSHICEHCGKAFYEKLVLDEHVKYTHLRKRKFVCDVCSKVFYRPGTLAKHKRCHTGKRPYVCSQCGQSFTVAYNLKVHQRLHTGERPYQCKQCDAAFAQKNSLDVHMRKHKKQEAGDWAPREASKARNQGETTKAPMAPPAHSNTGYPQYSGAVFPSYPLPAYPYYHNL
ncbi:zinc finger protein 664-like [Littorina saxatilis]|uniref:zinc finger protein 664-like n=1 Tax=Littorina saxatilis TaxID=31220 RepID=UPI0038B57CD4